VDAPWEGWLAFFRSLTSGNLPAGATTPGTQVGGAASRTAEERGLDVDNWVGRRQWTGAAGAALPLAVDAEQAARTIPDRTTTVAVARIVPGRG
jgi:hypothetical protein